MFNRHLLFASVGLLTAAIVASQISRRGISTHVDPASLAAYTAESLLATSRAVDEQFREHWRELALEPAETAPSLLIARRLSLGLTGSIPSLEEIRAMECLAPEQRLSWWLDRLFQDRRYSDYVAERLARAFVGTENGPFLVFRRRRFVAWLSDCLLENKPYDEIVRALISDQGVWTDAPGINFVTVTNGTNEEGQPDPARLAARTTRAFLGVRLDCVQCHDDHMGGTWRQADFHELAAFFSEARSSGLGIHDSQRDYAFQYLGADASQIISPAFPFAREVRVAGDRRRARLAAWVTHPENKAFARTAVNRIWALLFGRPLADEIDNISLAGPFPPGMELLAEDFAAHGFDVRRLITQIVMTQVFQLDSRSSHVVSASHERHWAIFPLTRLRPEQVAGGVVQSASLTTIDSNSHILVRLARSAQIGDFVKRYGDMGEDVFDQQGDTIPQRLLMLNGQLVKERTKDDFIANAATRIAQQVSDDAQALEAAFLCVLSRQPTPRELQHFGTVLRGLPTNRAQQLEDIYWALLNSTEFSWNH